ncbi:MAG: hypothetical protein E6I21_00225, partial [Chloroflexi bacterium]
WDKLRKAGARSQRCLWASTSTKDPRYPDTYYVEELIGPDTVDTIPPATLAAFREHGEVRRSLDENVDLARRQLKQLAGVGVDLDQVTHELEVEGVEAFQVFREPAGRAGEERQGHQSGQGTASVVQPRPAPAGGRYADREAAEGRRATPFVGEGLDPLERRPRQEAGDPRPPGMA